ncbi:MAG: signal recognition particle-docking protein FtsY [Gammaproteobacteria bacterium]|nr:signal recognition particle-docking protein FtsY [Gammaproteobacteria bacterium]
MTSDDTAAPKSPERGGLFALFRRRKDSAESAAPLQPTPEPAPEARVASLTDRVADSGLATPAVVVEKPAPIAAPAQGEEPARRGLFRRALARTGAGLGNLLLGRKAIDAELYEELETSLLMADVGVETASAVIAELTARVKRRNLGDAQALRGELRALLLELLEPCQQPLVIDRQTPFVMLVVGVNGVGKTTTIGKLAHRLQSEGRTLMLAAGDTFRAAAVEQLQAWGERNRVPVVSQGTGADSASVIFDAIQSAQARQLDVVIADTAGRLHTKDNLMAELTKVRRVMAKLDPDAPHETLLVLDAGTGQNAVVQMRQFSAAVAVTGIALTKLDGTAKGGVIFALCREFGVPIRYVGLGEGIDDLQPFDAELFVDALLATSDNVG